MQVSQFYNKNQFLIYDESNKTYFFQSYQSMICKLDTQNRKLYIYDDYDYSKTTLKHFYLFLNDFVYSIYKLIENSKTKLKDFNKLLNTVVNDIEIIQQ